MTLPFTFSLTHTHTLFQFTRTLGLNQSCLTTPLSFSFPNPLNSSCRLKTTSHRVNDHIFDNLGFWHEAQFFSMDGHTSSSGMYSFDVNTVPSTGLQTSQQSSSVLYVDDSHLVGAPVPVTGPALDVTTSVQNMIGAVDKRKRGRPPRYQVAKPPPPPKRQREEEEDVCFICFDGGSLVLCDRKGCPKAYHPACIKRDEAFFRSKAKWNCGWHICSVCQKASHYLCYTCTYSLCKACTKNADYLCVRGNKGFCSTCMRTIMLIENKGQANKEMVQVDFDDKSSWEYLFKVYWVILKDKLSLTFDELVQAKNPWKEPDAVHSKRQLLSYGHYVANGGKGIAANSFDHIELKKPIQPSELSKKDPSTTENRTMAEPNNVSILGSTQSDLIKPVEALEFQNEDCLRKKQGSTAVGTSMNGRMEWASKELLDFVAHVKDGDTSATSQFDVQALLLDYIKRKNLRDPRRKSQIICDSRLTSLFGKPRVGHIEMLKLLEFHFLIKEETQKSAFIPAGIVGTVIGHVEPDDNKGISSLMNNTKKRKTRKNGEVKMTQISLDEYAAIDAHNINFIYLRRDLMENLAEDVEKFRDRVIGSVVRIRIPGSDQKQEIYRLVHVVGTCKSSEPYKIRDKTVDILLEVLNLNKKEAVSIDSISNQDFCEDECRRLRQSIKCGLVKRLTVGEIQKKAMELRAVKLNDSLEAEMLRLNHLRDRASEKGLKKELRECIEKLVLLKTPEERQRRLLEIPEVHADPKMDPSYGSEGDDRESNEKRKVEYLPPRCTRISRRGEKLMSSGSPVKEEGSIMARCRVREKKEACGTNILNKLGSRLTIDQAVDRSGSEASVASLSAANSSSTNSCETEKLWHYRDPAGRIQGPFSVIQLRKWNTSGLFPPDMRIWANHEHDDSVLLTNALKGLFHRAPPQLYRKTSSQSQETASLDSRHSGKLSESAVGTGVECRKREASRHLHSANNNSNANTEVTRMDGLSSSFPKCLDLLKGNNSSSDKPQLSSPVHSPSQWEVILALPRQERGRENDTYRSTADHVTQNSHGGTICQKNDGYGLNSQSNSQNLAQPSGQNHGSFTSNRCSTNLDSGSTFASATKSSDSFEQKGKVNLPDLPSPTPEMSYGELEAEAAEKLLLLSSVIPVCGSDIHDLPSPTPTSDHEAHGGHVVESKKSDRSSPVQQSGPRWSNANHEAQDGHADGSKTSVPSSPPIQQSGSRWSNTNPEAQGGQAAEKKESFPSSLTVQESGPRWSNADHEAQVGHVAENKESFPSSLPVQESASRWSNASHETQGAHAAENKESVPSSRPVQESGPRWSNANHEAQSGHAAEIKESVPSGRPVQESGPRWSNENPEANHEAQCGQAAENKESVPPSCPVQESDPRWSNANHETQGGCAAENEESFPSSLPVQESGPRWSSASSLVIGGAQLREIGDEWGRCSPAAKQPTEEWDSGLVSISSLKPAEPVADHVATPTSNADQLNHTSPSHPVLNFFCEPIEFSTLAEESVSDLLAEVDAMESQNQNDMGSPTSAMRCGQEMIPGCKNDDCFSLIEELSPAHDPVKSDALSSTGDLQLPCQSTVTDETVGASRADAFDQLKRSGGNSSSSEGETKSADALFTQGEAGSNIPAPCTTSQTTAFSVMGRSTVLEGMTTTGRGTAPGVSFPQGEAGSNIPAPCTTNQTTAFSVMGRSTVLEGTTTTGRGTAPGVSFPQGEAGSNIQAPCTTSQTTTFSAMGRSTGLEGMTTGRGTALCVMVAQGDAGSNIQAPCTTSQTTTFSAMGRSTGLEGMTTTGRGTAPGNPTWGGPVQGYTIVGHGGGRGAAWGNSHMNRGAPFPGNPAWDSQRRYAGERSGGPRDWALQGGDSGYGRGRPSWNRQQPYGGGGGYSRPSPKGQRICKFYESGRCRKGSSCDYLHP